MEILVLILVAWGIAAAAVKGPTHTPCKPCQGGGKKVVGRHLFTCTNCDGTGQKVRARVKAPKSQ